jgi:hypothetical protein
VYERGVFLSVPRHEASTEFSLRVNKRGGAASLAPAHLAVASILSDSLNLSDSHSTLTSLHLSLLCISHLFASLTSLHRIPQQHQNAPRQPQPHGHSQLHIS